MAGRQGARTFGRICAGALLALSLAACGSQGTQESVSQSSSQPSVSSQLVEEKASSSSASTSEATPQYTYFDECPELAKPDSVIDCTQTGHTTDSNMNQYAFQVSGSDDEALSQAQTYVSAVASDDISVVTAWGTTWSVIDGGRLAATIEFDSSDNSLLVTIVDEADRLTVQFLSLGQTVTTDDYTLTLTDVEWAKSFQFNDVWGMGEESGSTYCVVRGTLKNTGSDALNLYDCVADFRNMNGTYHYTGSASTSGNDTSAVDPLQEVTVFFYARIPDELANNFQGGTLVFMLDDTTEYYLDFS